MDISHVMCPVRYAMVDAYTYTGYAIIVRGITTLWQFVINKEGWVGWTTYILHFFIPNVRRKITHLSNSDQSTQHNIDGLVQDSSNSIANALELLQSCIKSWYQSDKAFTTLKWCMLRMTFFNQLLRP